MKISKRKLLEVNPLSIWRILIVLLLTLMLLLPSIWQTVKAIIIIGLLLFSTIIYAQRRARIDRNLLYLTILYSSIGVIGSVHGLFSGAPGATSVLTVMFAYPLVFSYVFSSATKYDLNSISKLFYFIGAILIFFDISYIITSILGFNSLPKLVGELYDYRAVVDDSEDYFKFTLPNIASLIFLIPFFLSKLLWPSSDSKRWKDVILVVLGFVIALLSGRRALMFTMIAGPVIAFLLTSTARSTFSSFDFKFIIRIFLAVFPLAIIGYFVVVNIIGSDFFLYQITSIFDFSSNQSNIVRREQLSSLMRGIYDSPIFGFGAGSHPSYVRDSQMPWAYELFFISFVYQYGLLGFSFYAMGILFIIIFLVSEARKHGRSCLEFYFLSGFIAFMISAATNPYLGKFDFMWVIFIPYAMMNFRWSSRSLYGH